GHVWYSALVGWVNGWSDLDRVHDELAVAVRLLLPEQAAGAGATTVGATAGVATTGAATGAAAARS
ncbi:MAG TPA: hypothetical protein VMU09_02880, partial [Acidimicrobiales bacterium]|nr:hypothetical protein [Acidimicrobiales bacterium]